MLSQPFRLDFEHPGGRAAHTPDFLAIWPDSGRWLLDMRPRRLIREGDAVKFAAAEEAAAVCGWRYAVVPGWRPHVIGVLDAPSAQRRPLEDQLAVQDQPLRAVENEPLPFGDVTAGTSLQPRPLPPPRLPGLPRGQDEFPDHLPRPAPPHPHLPPMPLRPVRARPPPRRRPPDRTRTLQHPHHPRPTAHSAPTTGETSPGRYSATSTHTAAPHTQTTRRRHRPYGRSGGAFGARQARARIASMVRATLRVPFAQSRSRAVTRSSWYSRKGSGGVSGAVAWAMSSRVRR